jgi:hypothetical protein
MELARVCLDPISYPSRSFSFHSLRQMRHITTTKMSWQTECTRAYLLERYASFEATMEAAPGGCRISTLASRANGDAQMKLRWIHEERKKQASPRPWSVYLHLQGIEVPRGYDASHLCGRGLAGCSNMTHIIVEPHAMNLDRRDCHRRTVCPCPCGVEHPVQVCTHIPKCLQD